MHQGFERLPRRQTRNPEIGGYVPLAQTGAGRDRMGSDTLAQPVGHVSHAGADRRGGLLREAGGPRSAAARRVGSHLARSQEIGANSGTIIPGYCVGKRPVSVWPRTLRPNPIAV